MYLARRWDGWSGDGFWCCLAMGVDRVAFAGQVGRVIRRCGDRQRHG